MFTARGIALKSAPVQHDHAQGFTVLLSRSACARRAIVTLTARSYRSLINQWMPPRVGEMNDGDLEVFLSLVERHRSYMYNLALRMTDHEQDAKDVVQESLLNAFLRLDQFERRADLRTWLHRIVVNCALDQLRSQRRRPDVSNPRPLSDVVDTAASSSPDPERLVVSSDCRRQVAAAMNTMSPLERVTFALRHFEGCSISEIAQTVGIGQSAAKQHIFRAVRKLRLALDPQRSGL